MTRIAGLSPERARELIALADYLRATGFLTRADLPTPVTLTPQAPIYVTNDSGEEIPAYACMQVTGTEEIGSQNYLVVDKPVDTTGAAGAFLFNGSAAIADGDEGMAQCGPVVRAYKNTGTVTGGDKWIPVSGQWYIAAGSAGSLIACGADDVETNVLKVIDQSVGVNSMVMITPGGGIAARSGTTISSATCTIVNRSGSTISTGSATETVYNMSTAAVGNSVYIIAELTNIGWVAVWEDC